MSENKDWLEKAWEEKTLNESLSEVLKALRSLKPSQPGYRARKQELEEIAQEFRKKLGTLNPNGPYGKTKGVNSEGLDVFQKNGITAREVTVRLLRKDEYNQPDRVAIEARGTQRTVTCSELGLISRKDGLLNRAGKMLVALEQKTIPKNIEAPAQAMKELRKIFREIVMDKEPFHPKRRNWEPKFKLLDAIEAANKREADRAIHVPYDDKVQYDQENDQAGNFLKEYDE